jgi:probable F420-dependent oxidoreductase
VDLGKVGVWMSFRSVGEANAAEAARCVEQLGFGTLWLGGSPRLPSTRVLLEATESLIIGTSVVNTWAYEPAELAAEHAVLARDFPDRLLVGVGIGHPEATSHYAKPLASMRAFLDGLDDADPTLPRERRCLAALGPKMLELSAERSLGTLPYFTPVAHTRAARGLLGADALVAPELAVALDDDPDRGRAKAREYARLYLGLSNYATNLLRFEYTERDLADGGSDRLIDDVVPCGSAEQIATVVRAHLDAGADHVALQPIGVAGVPRPEWTALASALVG